MKRALIIVGLVALGTALLFGGMVWYLLSRTEEDKNRKKTEAARANRWAKRDEIPPVDQVPSEDEPPAHSDNGVELKQQQE